MGASDWLRRLAERYAAGVGCYAQQMGLPAAEWQALQRRLGRRATAPDAALAQRLALMSVLQSTRQEERERLAQWLAGYMADRAAPMHLIIASASLGFNHLWQDLGLDSRTELRALMTDCFPELVAMNKENMRWKKFFYRQRCLLAAGEVVCRSPSCDECCERALCFGPEV